MAIRPLGNAFLFCFLQETQGRGFTQKNKGRIILPNAAPDIDRQGDFARFAKVLAIGQSITDFKNGDVVLIAALKWTPGFTHDGVKIWKSDDSHVLGVWDSKNLDPIIYDFYASTRG